MRVANRDRLDHLVFVDAILASFAAVSTRVDPAKWRLASANLPRVHPNHSAPHPPRHTQDPADVFAEEIAGQSKLGLVRQFNGFFFRREFENRRERTKRLFRRHKHFPRDAREHGGFEEETRTFASLAPALQMCALG